MLVTRSVTLNTSYAYDSAGHLTGLTYPSGRSLAFSYDATGHISGITVDGTQLIGSISYQPFGPATNWSQGAGVSTYTRALRCPTAPVKSKMWTSGRSGKPSVARC